MSASPARRFAVLPALAAAAMGCGADDGLAPAPLRLSEIAAARGADPAWIEIENASDDAVDLGGYALVAPAADRATGLPSASGDVAFRLPHEDVPARAFVVIAADAREDLHDGPARAFITQGGDVPMLAQSGSIELVDAEGRTSDRVVFGDEGVPGRNAPPLPTGATRDGGETLARAPLGDDDGASAWTVRPWATPGGPNDVVDPADDDGDGIPDSAESPGGTFAGLPIYDFGARTGRRDVLVEIDWMDPTGYDGSFDAALEPREEALDELRRVFSAHGVALHLDAGELGGGGEIPFSCRTTMDADEADEQGVASFARLKAAHFDLRREPLFHYVVFASSQDDVACGDDGSSGTSRVPGRDALVSLGRWGFSDAIGPDRNFLVNAQASTLMHELGHNFGLRHGGDDDRDDKPGYLSVMSYLYDLVGLPALGPSSGDRYYYAHRLACGSHGVDDLDDLDASPLVDPSSFRLDYSDGSSAPLDEGAIDEVAGLGRPGSGPIDFDWDFAFTTKAQTDVDGSTAACPRDGAGRDLLTDHDDWSSLVLDLRGAPGSAAAGPARERRAPEGLLAHLRARASPSHQ